MMRWTTPWSAVLVAHTSTALQPSQATESAGSLAWAFHHSVTPKGLLLHCCDPRWLHPTSHLRPTSDSSRQRPLSISYRSAADLCEKLRHSPRRSDVSTPPTFSLTCCPSYMLCLTWLSLT
ncbi:hypothetical protein CC79DRAFT_1069756 [Sarocladium strictum]